MPALANLKKLIRKNVSPIEKDPVEAYDLWSADYDNQPGNLMLDLTEEIFTSLFDTVDIKNKAVADIGCGTGRHWKKIYEKHPSLLTGYDISEGMLKVLKQKYPQSITSCITDDLFTNVQAASCDLIISTLTVAHIKNIEEALNAWSRLLKPGGEIMITDFHPGLLARGGKRSFQHGQKQLYVTNYIHPLKKIISVLYKNGFTVEKQEERFLDDTVKKYYMNQNALPVFEKYKGMPVIYGLHLKRNNGIK